MGKIKSEMHNAKQVVQNIDMCWDVISYAGTKLAIISATKVNKLKKLRKADAVVLRFDRLMDAQAEVDAIRHYKDPRVALKPIYLHKSRDFQESDVLGIDGVLDPEQPSSDLLKDIKNINKGIIKCDFGWHSSMTPMQASCARHILFFLVRGLCRTVIKHSKKTASGYFFTMIDRHSSKSKEDFDYSYLLELASMVSAKMNIKDHLYHCPECNSPHIHIRESCPTCTSVHIKTQELVHHFSCAHVAPINDFERKSEWQKSLECPKCNKVLKHIGVDYDKPSEIFSCLSCHEHFQQAHMLARCVSCTVESPVNMLHKSTLYEFDINLDARAFCSLLVKQGTSLDRHSKIESLHIGEVKERDLPYQIIIENLDDIEKRIGHAKAEQLINDILDVVRASISSSDTCIRIANRVLFEQQLREMELGRQILDHTASLIENLISSSLNFEVKIGTCMTNNPVDQPEPKSLPTRILRAFSF